MGVLTEWRAQREAKRAAGELPPVNAGMHRSPLAQTYPLSSGTYGSELYEWLVGDMSSSASMPVNERTAMSIAAVYACVGLIAGAIASLPFHTFRATPEGRARIDPRSKGREADYADLINTSPHPSYSASVFWEYMVTSLLLHGDAFARIHRRGAQAEALEPLNPLAVTVANSADIGHLVYAWTDVGGAPQGVFADDMIHISGIGFDVATHRGLSPIRYAAKTSMGIALAADDWQQRFFSQGARPDFALTTDGDLNDKQIELLRHTWQERHGGVRRSHLPAVLSGGLKVQQLSLSTADAEIIATRSFQVQDICRIFGVPGHMIGSNEKSSSWGTGIEQMGIGFVKYTLQRHLVKFEQEVTRKLWRGDRQYFAEFDVSGLERGDYKTRNEGYRIALGRAGEAAWMTVNEVRARENLPPVDDGDDLPANPGSTRPNPTQPEPKDPDDA